MQQPLPWTSSTWPHNLSQQASGNPGAVQFVAAHASTMEPYENEAPKGVEVLNSVVGQELTDAIENGRKAVLAERDGTNFEGKINGTRSVHKDLDDA